MSQQQNDNSVSESSSAMTLKQRLATLSPDKLAALQRRLRQQERSGYEPIRARPDSSVYPLLLNQRRLWLIEQLQPGTPLYNVTRAVRLRGPLNHKALRLALQGLVDRHEALRTTFEMHDGEPVQRIRASTELQLPLIDLRTAAKNGDDLKSLLEERLKAEGRHAFELSTDLMLRTVLYQVANDEHVLQITIHHLACDGWSFRLLFDDLAEMYRNFCSGLTVPLNPTGMRYVDFAHWQQEPKQQDRFEDCAQWWNRELDGAPQVLEVTPDRPRPKIDSGSGAFQPFDISLDLQNQLEALGREENATLFTTLLTGFFILLHRYTGMEDFLVGSATAGRHHPESHRLVGFFVNTIVLRADLSGEPTARQLLRRVRQTVVDAVAHDDVPLERIVESFAPQKDPSRHPLFQVFFNAPPRFSVELEGLDVSLVHIDLEVSRFDLEMTWSGSHNRPAGMTWNTDMFEADTIQRLLGHYRVLLEAIAENPDEPVHQIPLLTKAERQQLLVEWSDTAVEYSHDKCVHELFEEQADRTPNAVAVVFEDRQLTYCELNERANQVAHLLIGQGVQPNALVGICVERSLDMAIGLLGILKAGGAYVPLDPDFPQERLRFMLEDADVRVLLTQEAVDSRLPNHTGPRLHLNHDNGSWKACPKSNPQVNSRPEDLAYVIFTSGSTGQPKGVQIQQRALVNLLESMAREPGIHSKDVLLAVTTLSFDIATSELLLPLLKGAKIVLVGRECATNGSDLRRAIDRNRVTVMQATPASWKLMIEAGWDGTKNLKILCGGEAMPPSLASQLVRRCSELWNLYGPTETTIWSTCCQVEDPSDIHIGKPIANTQVYILDGRRQLVPIGVPGELYIAGDGLADGYLNRSELTAAKFIPNSFSDDPDSRLYRTGDLCRWRPDGNLEFLGRLDHQVKLRGFRIEVGEIEAALNSHPAVAQGVVTLREDHPGDKRLVAYCVPQTAGAAPASSELRSCLRERLPDYMVPAAFIVLERLPLTPNGKIDRRGLPAPDDSRPDQDFGYVAPRTPVEEQLAFIWQEVLGLARVGVRDDFFALGGHSLLALQVSARIASSCEVDLPLRRLFETPTIRELAGEIEALRHEGPRTPRVMSKVMDQPPLSFAQQRLWFLGQLEGDLTAYNMPMAWRLRGALDVESLRRSLETIVQRHETLRTTFVMSGEEPVQVIGTIDRFELPVEDLRALEAEQQETEVAKLGRQEAERPFDLTSDLMLRGSLLRLTDDEHVLLLTLHHIASDGWSNGILLRELSESYTSHVAGREPSLSNVTVQYSDYAVWQRERLAGERGNRLVKYWTDRLRGAPPVLTLPTDYPRPKRQSYQGMRQTIVLDAVATQAIKKLGQDTGATNFMTMLAAFQLLLSRLSGQNDVVVGSPVAGRVCPEVEPLMGFFVNAVVLRSDFSGDLSFRELLLQVRATALGAYEHHELPFERLVGELLPEKDLSRTPLFQVMFNGANTGQVELQLPGLRVERAEFRKSVQSKYDLTVYLREEDPGLILDLVYNADLFTSDRIDEMRRQFSTLLSQIVEDPGRGIDSYSLVTCETRELLPDPRIPLEVPSQADVNVQVAAWAKKAPNQIAIECGDSSWTYRELIDAADQISQQLLSGGITQGDALAIVGEPSFGLIAAMIGVLNCRGVIVPIDTNLPAARVQTLIEQANVCLVVAVGSSGRDHAAVQSGEAFIAVDDTTGRVVSNYVADAAEPVRPGQRLPEEAAYIFFTSGTTGVPKGIVGSHRGLSHFVNWQREQFNVNSNDRVAQVTGLSFDVVLREIFLPLTSGATLCLPDRPVDAVGEIWHWMDDKQVTILHSVPSRLQTWLATVPGEVFLNSLRWLFMAGEPLSDTMVRKWRCCSSGDVVNLYGPTETTLAKLWYRVPSNDEVRHGIQPLGRPLPQTQALVLSENNRLCGVGEPGEIVVRTPFRTLGYLCEQENEGAFIQNPFRDDASDVLYKTGDLGRYLPDGQIEISGRIDDQVKIRGIRIEPAEVAATLAGHDDVDHCHVGVLQDQQDGVRLVAWVMAMEGREITVGDLRFYLASHLPQALVPSEFVLLGELPLTPSGKVDRRALPTPGDSRLELKTSYVAPRTPLEEQLVAIWQEVLGLEQVGVHDNFFALGGHSLLATQVTSRIGSIFGVNLPLRRLFDRPTIGELTAEIEVLRGGETSNRSVALRPMDRDQIDRLPLSFAQQRLWFLDQLEGELTAYNLPIAWRLDGILDEEALRRALEFIVQRHESLRTNFTMFGEEPVQVIGAIDRFELPVEDLSTLKSDQREAEIARSIQLAAERPFDLATDLMLRASLLRVSDDQHVLLLAMHHIASDGWSLGVLRRELGEAYAAYCRGVEPQLPGLPVQYADYALWQRRELQGQRLDQLLDYWRGQLEGVSSLELPTDRPRPLAVTYQGARHAFELSEKLVDRLKSLGRAEGVTLHMVLLAAFQVLLFRYSGQDDIAVGTPIAGRNHSDLEGQIGFFVNTLVLRTDLSGAPTFRELLNRVRKVSLAAYDHQDLPFEKLVEELQPERHLSRSPLFQVLFQLLTFSDQALALGDLDVSRLPTTRGTKFDLAVHLRQESRKLHGTVSYSTHLFDHSTIERMIGHYVMLLERTVASPDQRLSEIPLVTEQERHQLLVDWNDTAAEYPSDKCVHELFEHQVKRSPTSVAAVFQDQQMTYEDLNWRANQLADWLVQSGAVPQSMIGICIEPSLEMLVAVLGVLKAGCGYVPIDGSYPRERIAFVLRDADIQVLLTQDHVPDGLAELDVRCLNLDSDLKSVDGKAAADPPLRSNADAPAYVIYTSGSTGRPKGVVVTHRSVCNYLFWVRERLLAECVHVIPLTTSLSFDAVLKQLFVPLLSGHAVHLVAQEDRYQPQSLLRQLCLQPRSAFNGVPALWQAILTIIESSQADVPLHHLTHVLLGGEPLSPSLVRRTFAALPHVRIWNFYGPTETTANSTAVRITPEAPISIGKPLANTRVYLLDTFCQLVPVGVPGELYIGGDGVARGYLNRPELTAEKFIANPFDKDPDSRLYRTGDLCRWRADGNLEFLGRLDDQVKLRGFRIELGEVETVLNEHPDVEQCVVAVREDRPGDKRLVAYCAPATGTTITFSELRCHLQSRLPDYMLPSAFVELNAFPLTPNGKINRRGLPAPDDSRSELETGCVAPRTPLEEQLAAIWQEVLGLGQVGVHDDFFALGGHSLLATKVKSRIGSIFGVNLPLRRLFDRPTIGELTEEIEALRSGGTSSRSVALRPMDRDQIDRLPLSFAQQRLWFLEQLEGELTAYNMPMAWCLGGTLDDESLRRALETIVRRHESLRTNFTMSGEEPVQLIGTLDRFELPVEDLSTLELDQREAEIVRLGQLEAERPFDLASDLMLRALLLRVSDDQHVLLLTIHHIASDGWSAGVLRRELGECYAAHCSGVDPQLPRLRVQYADYALWQRRGLQGQRLDDLLHYWRGQLDGVSTLELPTDRPRPLAVTYQGARHTFELSEELVDRLKSLGRAEGGTLHMILLAAFQTLLSRYSGQDDIAVGTPIAGRNHSDLEGQIGFFVNTMVLRTNLSDAPTFREVLNRVRQVSLAAYDHQDLPFEKLVEELQPERHLSRSPLFQVLFQLLSFSNRDLALQDLAVTRLPSGSQRVRFDLEMNLRQQPKTIRGDLIYSTDLFDRSTIERMVGHFLTLLEEIGANPDQRVDKLPLLTAPERNQLLVQWNDTTVDYPGKCIHQLFEEQVQQTPDAVAVVFEDQHLTYCELNERSNQLAHHLRSLGVGPDVLVGIYVEQSLEMGIAVLGVLKAGGAYVPLSRSYPKERLGWMLEDAQVPILLCPRSLEAELPRHRAQVVYLDVNCTEIARLSHENLEPSAGLGDLVYVLYTSGSTGRPKGVAFLHRGAVNLIRWQLRNNLTPSGLRALLFSPLSFDASFTDMFMTWCSGGTLVMATDEMRLDPAQLADLVRREAIERINLPFVALQSLASFAAGRGEPMVFPALRQVFSTAEQLHITPDIRDWLQANPEVELQNQYGPTETHVATALSLQGSADTWPSTPSIGKPIANTGIYILDQHLAAVPVGVVGNLYIAGDGLARGYLNRPELTAEKFIGNPFDKDPDSRLYRTGDLCRWRADGNLEFLGRLDDQVKLRGFRIELGEIETVLNEHPDVAQCVVTVREDRPGDKRLVTYCVPVTHTALDVSKLRGHLQKRMPDYMVPSTFIGLDALPLTPSGKVNRRGLPAPDDSRPELETGYVAPRTPLEEQLVTIWCEVLGIQRVGIHDNFFALGGHSLLATRMNARIASTCEVELPLRCLFEAPTIGELADEIKTLRGGVVGPRSAALKPIDRARTDQLPLSFAQQRLWFLEQLEGELTAYNMSMAWCLGGTLDVEALRRALEAIVRRHETLRTAFTISGEEPVQTIRRIDRFELPLNDLSSLEPEQREAALARLSQLEAERPFDLASDLMLRASLLRVSDDEHVLLLTMHHVACDGWSMGILLRELSEFYASYAAGREPSRPDLSVQYADYAVWQREQLSGERADQLVSYWTDRLRGAPPVLNLPTDHPRPKRQAYRGTRQTITLDAALTKAVKNLGQDTGATSFMTMLTVFQLLLSRLSGQNDVVVGSPVAGRVCPEVEPLIGFFVNTVVLRSNLFGNPSFRELLVRVRSAALDAYDHHELPFERLVEELQPEKDLSRTPLFQVMFNGADTGKRGLQLPGIRVERPRFRRNVHSKFDLTVYLREEDSGLTLDLVFNADLFSTDRIDEMVRQFSTLVSQVAENPDRGIDSYSLVTAEARESLPDPRVPLEMPPQTNVNLQVAAWVKKTPDQIAIECGDASWTYRELVDAADQISQQLLSGGITQGDALAIVGEPSFGLIVAMIGVLNCRAVIVPIDPNLPAARVKKLIEQANVCLVVVVGSSGRDHAAAQSGEAFIAVDDTTGRVVSSRGTDAAEPVRPEQRLPEEAAYIFFTSGTTGVPKGIVGSHRGLSHFINWQREQFNVNPNDRVAQVTGLSFDVVLREIFLPLTSGATLCLPEGPIDAAGEIWHWMDEKQVTILHSVPSRLQAWLATVPNELSLDSLRWLFIVGEPLPDTLVNEWRSSVPGDMINLYGTTEAGPPKLWYLVPSNDEVRHGIQPLGRPLPQTQALVLSKNNCLCGVGEPGEIVVRTPFRTLGYLCEQENEGAFIQNPFRDDDSDVLYKTGDLGRYLPDGQIEIFGRIDDQVKIRGVRIEPREIEKVLRGLPQISDALVVAREEECTGKRLIAYVVGEQTNPPTAESLRQSLRAELPDYMIPSAFVPLDALPLNPNGKVDRRALPAPEFDRSAFGTKLIAPRTSLEKDLAEIWQDVLMLAEPPGVANSFFDLGGHSLLSASLVARVERSLKVKVPLREFFEDPTIAGLAQAIEAEGRVANLDVEGPQPDLISRQPLPDHSRQSFVSRWREARANLARLVARTTRSVKKRLPAVRLLDESTIGGPDQAIETEEGNAKVAARGADGNSMVRWPLPDELYRPLQSYVGSWQGERASTHSLIVGRNTSGSKPPLFWVFQGEREFSQLARYLGPDQPLYGMRSGHLIMSYEEDNIQAFAFRYVEEILAVRPAGPVCIGGNCQGGLIALAIAQHLIRRQRTVPLLVLMEWHYDTQPYPEPVALLFGAESTVANPWLKGVRHPEVAWRRDFPRYRVAIMRGQHGQFFDEPNVQSLASALGRCLTEAVEPASFGSPAEEAREEGSDRRPGGIPSGPALSVSNGNGAVKPKNQMWYSL